MFGVARLPYSVVSFLSLSRPLSSHAVLLRHVLFISHRQDAARMAGGCGMLVCRANRLFCSRWKQMTWSDQSSAKASCEQAFYSALPFCFEFLNLLTSTSIALPTRAWSSLRYPNLKSSSSHTKRGARNTACTMLSSRAGARPSKTP